MFFAEDLTPHQKKTFLEARTRITRQIRAYFDGQEFTEVAAPCLVPCPTMDPHIHGFEVPQGQGYLHTSPEFAMKKLLCDGWERIYALGPVWRQEVAGRWHAIEFTMLEWYRTGADYKALIADCRVLLSVAPSYHAGDSICDPNLEWQIITVSQAFDKYAKIKLDDILGDTVRIANAARSLGVRVVESDTFEDIFFAIMAQCIEPHLGTPAPTVLTHYPASMAALARLAPEDTRWAERIEIYVAGIELANGFSELTDADQQRKRFITDRIEKQRLYGFSYAPDETFLKALEYGMPESAGMALGLERLIMLATGAAHIKDVCWG